MSRLDGRAAIVTGAGSGNGRAIAERLASEGARVACADLDAGGAAETARSIGGEAIAVQMDHTVSADCRRAAEAALAAFGIVDILVNNAGVAVLGTALEVSEEEFMRQLRINVLGPLLMTQAVLPRMVERGRGSIVMIASAAGLQARQAGAPYVTSKHALVGLTRSLAADYAAHGIRVNAVCPGLIRTPMAEGYIEYRARRKGRSVAETVAEIGREFPLGRVGEPGDVAAAVLHFADDESAWVTGQAYLIDGGQSLLGPRLPLPPSAPPSGSS